MNAKLAAIVFGVVFIVVGALGYVPNPIVGPTGIFVTNHTHDLIHVVSGLVLLLGAYSGLGASTALKIIGIVYGIVAVLGFVMMGDMMLGMIAMNAADRILHVALAAVILIAGFALPGESKPAAA